MSTYGTKRTFQPHPAIVRFWGKRSILEPDFRDFMADKGSAEGMALCWPTISPARLGVRKTQGID
jgi:hypothetical protein